MAKGRVVSSAAGGSGGTTSLPVEVGWHPSDGLVGLHVVGLPTAGMERGVVRAQVHGEGYYLVEGPSYMRIVTFTDMTASSVEFFVSEEAAELAAQVDAEPAA